MRDQGQGYQSYDEARIIKAAQEQQAYSKVGCLTDPIAREKTAREVLAEQIEKKRRELADLDVLYRALPLELPFDADRALRRALGAA